MNAGEIKPPAEVSLDFASFSEKQKFTDVTTVAFITDQKMTYQTEGQFSTSKLADGMFSEFLYLKIPSSVFIKIASGNSISIKLKNHVYELDELSVLQLQRMSDYLK